MKKIFKNKQPEAKQADKNKKKLTAPIDNLSAEEILHIAQNSEEISLREKAISALNYQQALLSLALAEGPGRVTQAARRRVGQLLEEDNQRLETLIQDGTQPAELVKLTSHSRLASEKLIERIEDEELLLNLALQGATSVLRQKAAEKIVSRSGLEKLIKGAKDKDKSVYQSTRQKLDVFKAADKKLSGERELAAELVAKLEGLASKFMDASYARKLENIDAAWSELGGDIQASHKEAYTHALHTCQSRISAQINEENAKAETIEIDIQSKKDLQDIIDNTRRLIAGLYDTEAIDSEQENLFSSAIELMDSVASRVKERNLALKTEFKTYHSLTEAAQQLQLELKTQGSFPEQVKKIEQDSDESKVILDKLLRYRKFLLGEEPKILARADESIKSWLKDKKDKAAIEKKLVTDATDLLRKAHWAVNGGKVRQARGIYKDIIKKRDQHRGFPIGLQTKIEDLEESIGKLGDWHDFAVHPKKQELVDVMEGLTSSPLAPADLAEKIKSLQTQWKTLCKGGENQDEELWQRFQAAADNAWLPCQEHFDEQDKEREQNLQKRIDLRVQMEEYYANCDWENATWKDVEKTLRVARETWLSYWPLPRKNIKEEQKSFDATMEKISAKLQAAYAQNGEEKSRLIEQAGKLAEQQDNNAAIDAAKRLQSQWKLIGPSERKNDQKLWKAFRAHCDEVFERRSKQQEEVKQQQNSEKDKALTLLKKLDDCLKKTGEEFLSALNEVSECKKAFSEVGELPRNAQEKISRDFNNRLEKIEKKKKSTQLEQVKQSWQDLFNLSEKLAAYERSLVARDENSPQQHSIVEEAMSSMLSWPSGGRAAIQKRLDDANALNSQNLQENERYLRELCIQAELDSGRESPEEDKSLRMEYQISQLQKGFGNKTKQKPGFSDIALQWIAIAGVDSTLHNTLLERFKACQLSL